MKSPLLVSRIFTCIVMLSLIAALVPAQTAFGQTNTVTVNASADAAVDKNNPTLNYGDKTYLTVDNSPVIHSYLSFNVAGLNGASITSAKLRLYSLYAGSALSVSVGNGNFSEMDINFNNAPTYGSAVRSLSSFAANTWLTLDVTGAVKGEGQVTLVLTTTSSGAFTVASHERNSGAYAPQLVLTTGTAAAPTATTAPTKAPTTAPTSAPTTAPTSAPTATKAPTSAPTATPAQSGTWTFCANEGDTCTVPGTAQVRYGANGYYNYKTVTSSVACTNAVFGDPIQYTVKTCSYQTGSAPAPTTAPTTGPTAAPTATRAPTTAPTPTVAPTSSGGTNPYNVPGTWTLKFSDDFNGSSLDLNKWEPNWLAGNDTTITKPINGQELSCYDPAQVSVANGSLKLAAVQRSCKASNGTTYNYASGIVTSRPHFTFNYGYMEARVWVDGTTSIKNWPAFWADGTGTWPTTGEIDVFEGLSGKASWHYHYGTTSSPQQVGGYPSLSSPGGWHIFGADWESGVIKFYYDGALVGTVTSGVVNSSMFIILNYGLSNNTPISVPSNFLVDYVRVWQH